MTPSSGRTRVAGKSTGCRFIDSFSLQPVLLQPAVELRPGQPEEAGGLGLVVAGLPESLLDIGALHRLEIDPSAGDLAGLRNGGGKRRLAQGHGEVLAGDEPPLAEDDGTLHGVAQLAD